MLTRTSIKRSVFEVGKLLTSKQIVYFGLELMFILTMLSVAQTIRR
jgi:hypothetical protein